MKKLILVISVLAIAAVLFAGCRPNRRAGVRGEDGRISVTTTIFPPYDFVRNIAGDRVNLTMLLSPGAESHSFEPSPRDIITIQNSDLFIYIGGHADVWVDRILEGMDTDNMIILSMMDMVELLEEEIVEGMEHYHYCHECGEYHVHHHDHNECAHHHAEHHHHGHEHAHHHHHCGGHIYDEHVWTSPRNAILIVQAITDLLSEIDPDNAYYFQENAAAYIKELEEIDAAFRKVVDTAVRRTIVFGDRFPFRYFAHAYGLRYYAAFAGCSTHTEPSAATVAFLINKIRTEQIPVVFHIELSNKRLADTISEETGARKLMLHSLHNLSRRDFNAGLGYLYFMRRNVENLRKALH